MLKRKLYINIALMCTISILVLSLILVGIFYRFYESKEKDNLIADANLIAQTMEAFNLDNNKYLETIIDRDINLRITLIDPDGQVKFDSSTDSRNMENHGDRLEIKAAIKEGRGETTRYSKTLSKASYYYALLLSDRSVLRLAREIDSLILVFWGIIPTIIGIIMIFLILSFIMASILTKNIVRPIDKATENIENIINGNEIIKIDTYEEIGPFIKGLNLQSKKIHEHIKNLKEAEKIRREFSANVSHELKTPLTSINGYAEMIATGIAKDQDAINFARIIKEEGMRLLGLIDTIIRLSELDEKRDREDFEKIDIYELTINIAKTLNLRAREKKVSINIFGKKSMITANKIMMEELLFNLIDNSIKYNKINGRVNIFIDNDIDNIIIRVVDTGRGIPWEDQKRIFERFYRVDKSRSKKTSGSGLGLSIVKHIVEYHEATIKVKSEENVGTEVIVTIKNP